EINRIRTPENYRITMAEGEVKISQLPTGATLNGSEKVEAVQEYESVQISVDQIAEYAAGKSLIAKLINVNLKDEVETPLDWVGDFSAANSIPFKALVIPKSGAFSQKGLDAT